MLRRLSHYLRNNVLALLALFVAVGTGGAYAANEWTGDNIVDGSLTGQDIFNNTVSGADITNGSLTGADVFDNTLGGADITNGSLTGADIQDNSVGFQDIGSQEVGSDEVQNDSLLQSDIRAGAVTGDEVLDNSLTGADINESALNLPSRARFVSVSGFDSTVASTQVPEGNYLVYLSANYRTEANDGQGKRVLCELFSQPAGQAAGFIGDTRSIDRTTLDNPLDPRTATFESLSTMGGAALGPGGGTVYAVCGKEGASRDYFTGAFWVIQVGSFF